MKALKQKLFLICLAVMVMLSMNTGLLMAEETESGEGKLEGQWESSITADNGTEYKYNFDFYLNGEVLITRKIIKEESVDEIDQLLNYSISTNDDIFKGALKIDLPTNDEGELVVGAIYEFENLLIEENGRTGYILMFDQNAPDESLVGKQMKLKKISDKHLYQSKEDEQEVKAFLNSVWFPIIICGIVLVIGIAVIFIIRYRIKKKSAGK